MCQKTSFWDTLKKEKQNNNKNVTVIPAEPLLLSPTPPPKIKTQQTNKQEKKSQKENYLYIYFSGEEVMEADDKSEGKITTGIDKQTLNKWFFWLIGCLSSGTYIDTKGGGNCLLDDDDNDNKFPKIFNE